MTITAQNLLTTLGKRAWSGFNSDDMIFTSDDSLQARSELNAAVRYLMNLEDFPFRAKTKNLLLISGISQYTMPSGQVTEIYNNDNLNKLIYIGDGSDKEPQKGEPTEYWISYKNPKAYINVYPTPDKTYNYTLTYSQFMPVMATDKTTKFEFSAADDFINLPAHLEYLFADCLVLRTMIQNNKDLQDENYKPMIDEFNESWRVFKRACSPSKIKPRVIWNQV